MKKIAVVYWSGTGNTKQMADSVVMGIEENGASAELFSADDFDAEKIDYYDAVAFGCPAMGAEELEDSEFLPMFIKCGAKLNKKEIALFGSYGWGKGEWMRDWEKTCKDLGAVLMCDSVICNDAPDDEANTACRDLGKSLS